MIRPARAVATAILCITAMSAAHASGTQPRSWVSAAKGVDAANCGAVTSPCRSLQYALDNAVVASGTILVLDPGGYGTLAISNSISIINDGAGTAGVFGVDATTKEAVSIDLPAGGTVRLKGLIINGGNATGNGVHMTSAGSLTIENCDIGGFAGSLLTGIGVWINPKSSVAQFLITDTTVTGNPAFGVLVAPNYPGTGAGSAEGAVRKSRISNSGAGIYAKGNFTSAALRVTVSDSVVTQNKFDGLAVQGDHTMIEMNHVAVTRNGNGITGFDVNNAGAGAVMRSYGNNEYDTSSGTISGHALH